MFKQYFSESLNKLTGILPFQAHSHHLWPNIAKLAMIDYWDDSTKFIDNKWDKIFSTIIPEASKIICDSLNLKDYDQITFAPNTHELIDRVLSSFKNYSNLKILTTDSEFHSLSRQLKSLEINHKTYIKKVSIDSNDPKKNIIKELKENDYDILVFSQCFYNSGIFIEDNEIVEIVNTAKKDTITLVDGYHSFATRNMDFSNISNRLYFVSGGYKYAMSGEGVCFLYSPKENELKPTNTGWMSEIDKLNNYNQNELYYSNTGLKFAGATFDPSGIYRFHKIWNYFCDKNINFDNIHKYVLELQEYFLKKLEENKNIFKNANLIYNHKRPQAHFFSFKFENRDDAQEYYQKLKSLEIICDLRSKVIRIGFGAYLDKEDINSFFERMT